MHLKTRNQKEGMIINGEVMTKFLTIRGVIFQL